MESGKDSAENGKINEELGKRLQFSNLISRGFSHCGKSAEESLHLAAATCLGYYCGSFPTNEGACLFEGGLSKGGNRTLARVHGQVPVPKGAGRAAIVSPES